MVTPDASPCGLWMLAQTARPGRLEREAPGQLDLSWTRALGHLQCRDLAEARGYGRVQTARRRVVRMIEHIRDLRADFETRGFRDGESLQQREGNSLGRGSLDSAVLRISETP